MLQEAASDSYGPFSDAEERNNHEDGAGSIIAAPIRRVGGNVRLGTMLCPICADDVLHD